MSAALQSASQVSLKRECERKYAFSYVYGLRQPETPSQALGKDVDDNQLQPYLRDGRPFIFTNDDGTPRESGPIAASGVHWLPTPRAAGLEVQKHFVLPSPSKKFSYQGYLDLWLPKRGLPNLEEIGCIVHQECLADPTKARECAAQYDHLAVSGAIPIVSDFKTTKSKDWVKSRKQLSVDVQAQLYATWAMFATGARVIDLAWIYFQTKGARNSYRTIGRVTAAHVYEQFIEIDKTGKQIYELRQAAARLEPLSDAAKDFVLGLEPNPEACGNFGGCPYRHLCNLSPSDFVDSIEPPKHIPENWRLPVVSETIDLFASLEKRVAPESPTEPVVLGINPPEAKTLPPAPPVGSTPIPEATEEPAPKAKRTRRTKAQIAKDLAEARGTTSVTVEADGSLSVSSDQPIGVVAEPDDEPAPDTVDMTDFLIAWSELGAAASRVLLAARNVLKVAV